MRSGLRSIRVSPSSKKLARRKQERNKFEYFPNLKEGQRKESVGSGLLHSFFAAREFVVADPQPDIGDDLWFAHSRYPQVIRAQVKSGFTPEIRNEGRSYKISLQSSNLEYALCLPNYVYLFVLADGRFHGFGEGIVEKNGEAIALCLSEELRDEFSEFTKTKETNEGIVHYYHARPTGYHFGCIPAKILGHFLEDDRTRGKTKQRVDFQLRVKNVIVQQKHGFEYWIRDENITKFFGQLDQGISALLA